MSDTWSEIQALKNKQQSMRAKMLEKRKQRENLLAGVPLKKPALEKSKTSSSASSIVPRKSEEKTTETSKPASTVINNPEVEKKLFAILNDYTLNYPKNILDLMKSLQLEDSLLSVVEFYIEKFATQQLITVQEQSKDNSGTGKWLIISADHTKVSAVCDSLDIKTSNKVTEDSSKKPTEKNSQSKTATLESLLAEHSAKEKEVGKLNEEIDNLLSEPTAKDQSLSERFRSIGGTSVSEFCPHVTRFQCPKGNNCPKIHFKKLIHKHTDENLGDCSFLNTCFHVDTCKYIHYRIESAEDVPGSQVQKLGINTKIKMTPAQWVQCDLRSFDMSILGKFSVIMADPPWDIHMELPYGTMSDDEMRQLNIPCLQDEGFIFLWVTGRAMELGRECLRFWGYDRANELLWVKTNQLQRIIRTGRTGHWLNHGKEHCLVGRKGNPSGVNYGLDADVIVSEVRETSRKPDEIYGIIERLSPGTRKIELFGRPHNMQPNWTTLGNQVDGVRLVEPGIVSQFLKKFPDGNCMGPSKEKRLK